ncbi:UNVERIFIED_CONTAM: hypothetical protein FKN15_033931 [Acipenser sinensis]
MKSESFILPFLIPDILYITQQASVPSPPGDEEDDFILVHHSDVQISQKAEDVYMQLAKILKEQCEVNTDMNVIYFLSFQKCVSYSKQFTHLGNITETTKFEKMSEECKKNLAILKLAQAQGLDPPKHHFEKRTYSIVRICMNFKYSTVNKLLHPGAYAVNPLD